MRIAVLVGLGLLMSACVETPQGVDGRKEFNDKCAACHGIDAKGEGSFGQNLFVVPPDLTNLSIDNGGVFPRDEVMSIIDGLSRDPHFSRAMPEFGLGDLGDVIIVEEDGVGTPVPEKLLALTDYLESIQN